MRTTPTSMPLSEANPEAAPQARPGVRMQITTLRTATVPWSIGIFCALVGTLMLTVPHQFRSQIFGIVRPVLLPIGTAYLFIGCGLLVTAALPPIRRRTILAHFAACVAFLFLAYILFNGGSWSGGFLYTSLGLGTLVAGGIIAARPHSPTSGQGDLLAMLLGFCALCNGLSLLLLTNQLQPAIDQQIRPYIPWFGVGFVLCGVLLIMAQFRTRLPRPLFWAVHLFAGAVFLSYMYLVSIPSGSITGIVFYSGFGLLLGMLPWLGRHIAGMDPYSLRLRLGLLLAAAVVVPPTLMVGFITIQHENLALQEALISQKLLAATQAQEIESYIELHLNAVTALATQLNPQRQPPAEQRILLQAFVQSYPELLSCVNYDSTGQGLARSDDQPPTTRAETQAFIDKVRRQAPALDLRVSSIVERPIVVVAASLRDDAGDFAGIVGCGLETTQLARMLDRLSAEGDRSVYVIDEQGRGIALNSEASTTAFPDLSVLPAVDALLHSDKPFDALRIDEGLGNRVAGFARMERIGWGVVVEYPVSRALANIHLARQATFWVLLLLAIGAMVVGILLASYLTRPLRTLIHAVDRFAHGTADAPLPQQSVTELTQLTNTFGDMRAQLVETAEGREQAIKLRDLFFSVAAHELKTPLTSLIGQAELLQRRAQRDPALAERYQRSMEVIVAQAYRLNRMVTALLDISRLQHGQLTLDSAPLDLNQLVRQVVTEIQPTLERHTVNYIGDNQPLMVIGDGLRLEQVLQNLVNNAVKYSPSGGSVDVRIDQHDGEVRVAVTDHGIGIPASVLPHVFQRFFRAPDAKRSNIAGMGIGLYVVKEILTLHGGSATVESVVDQGSTFTISLPLATEQRSSDEG